MGEGAGGEDVRGKREEGRSYGVGAVAHGVCVFFRLRRNGEVTQISFACGENVMSHRKHRNHRKFLPAAK